MATRARRRTIRDTEKRTTVPAFIIKPLTENILNSIREVTDINVLNMETIKKINAINYVNQFYPQLESFLDFYHKSFYQIIDMVTMGVDITLIIAYAKNLAGFSKTEVESLAYIPGTKDLIVELYQCEELLLDILDDVMKNVEPPLIKRRLEFMKRLLNKITQKYE